MHSIFLHLFIPSIVVHLIVAVVALVAVSYVLTVTLIPQVVSDQISPLPPFFVLPSMRSAHLWFVLYTSYLVHRLLGYIACPLGAAKVVFIIGLSYDHHPLFI